MYVCVYKLLVYGVVLVHVKRLRHPMPDPADVSARFLSLGVIARCEQKHMHTRLL